MFEPIVHRFMRAESNIINLDLPARLRNDQQ